MKRVIIVGLIALLGALYLYSAFSRRRSGKPVLYGIGTLRRLVDAVLGVILIVIVLSLVYAALFQD